MSADGVIGYCMRVGAGSFKMARNGAHMHRLRDDLLLPPPVAAKTLPVETLRAPVDHIHQVYVEFLGLLGLRAEDRDNLRARGLDDAAINSNGYASTPGHEAGDRLAQSLSGRELAGVPGFFNRAGRWQAVWMQPGILIPYRDSRGRIRGLQYRLSKWTAADGGSKFRWLSSPPEKYAGGSSSGAPLHVSQPSLIADASEILLTEGAMKADVIAHLLHVPVIASAGVALFGSNFGDQFHARYPDKTAILCFDSDYLVNPSVKRALLALVDQLSKARVKWKVRTWPDQYKGYDDYLCAARQSEAREVAA